MPKGKLFFNSFIAAIFILILLVFIDFCLAQNFYPSAYPAQIRLGTRNSRNNNDLWGYTDIFIPIYNYKDSITYGGKDFLIFVNPKITATDFSTDEQNLGIGMRYLGGDVLLEERFILGLNFFYDSAYSRNGIRHNQLGVGVEFLSKWLDFRSNHYQPLSDKRAVSVSYDFTQQSLIETFKYEEPLAGFDMEVGVLVPFVSNFIETRIYGGGYWYDSDLVQKIEGSKARIEINPSPFVTFTAETRDDNVFGSDFFVGGYISLPFDIGNLLQRRNPFEGWTETVRFKQGPRDISQRMTDPVVRDIDIRTTDRQESQKMHDVIFVDNSNDSDIAEDGSRDNPHNTLAEAFTNPLYTPGVMIFVKKGDGTNTGYTGNFTLANNVILWGEGYQYLGLEGGGYPIIDGNNSGDVITLADNNTVMGLKIQNGAAASAGIYGVNITAANIHHNIITNNNGYGIYLSNTGGGTLDGRVENNFINNSAGFGLWVENNSSTVAITISGNQINNNSNHGIELDNTNGIVTATISGNTIDSNVEAGIRSYTLQNGTTTLTITGNDIINTSRANGDPTAGIMLDNGYASPLGPGNLTATVDYNRISDNTHHGVLVRHALFGGETKLSMSRNIIKNNGAIGEFAGDGVQLWNSGTLTADLGGGILGAEGYNSIYDNLDTDLNNDGIPGDSPDATVSALNNWWGKTPPGSTQFKQVPISLRIPYLSTNPNE